MRSDSESRKQGVLWGPGVILPFRITEASPMRFSGLAWLTLWSLHSPSRHLITNPKQYSDHNTYCPHGVCEWGLQRGRLPCLAQGEHLRRKLIPTEVQSTQQASCLYPIPKTTCSSQETTPFHQPYWWHQVLLKHLRFPCGRKSCSEFRCWWSSKRGPHWV